MKNNLGIKMREVLMLEQFTDSEILCGHGGLDRYVTKVNVMEVPDILNWVKEGEFLLTTAYSIKDDIQKLNDLIPLMKKKGLAGLGIKMKRYIDVLPENIIQTANALDFPIIGIPLDISFGDVITSILTSVVNKQTSLLIQIDHFNNQLKDILLRGGSLKEIAEMISAAVKAPVAITEDIFKDYVIVGDELFKPHLLPIIESFFIKKAPSRSRKSALDYRVEKVEDTVGDQTIDRLMIPIYSADVLYGHVIIWKTNMNISDTTLFMIEAAASLIALNSSKKLSIYENENKHKIEFIEELLSNQENHLSRALEKASYFEFDKHKTYGVVVVSVQERVKGIQMTPNNTKILKQLNSKLVSVVERVHRFYKGELIYGNKSDRVIFLLGFDHQYDTEMMKTHILAFVDELMHIAKMENIYNDVCVGIGRTYSNYKDLYKSYREANRVIHKLMLSNGPDRSMHFDALGIYRIISNEEIQPELYQFFLEILGPIVAYDKEKDAELLNTLKMYYACGCNLKRVSEEMFTHYNTVIYRMQRIREIGHLDLTDPNVSLNVHMALKILDVINPLATID